MLEKKRPIKRSFKSPFPFTAKASILIAFLVGLGVGIAFEPFPHPPEATSPTGQVQISACFSPGGHCTDKILSAIHSTQSSIDVMAYSFTSAAIAHALVKAHERGVQVKILIDRSQLKAKHSQLSFLLEKGIPISIDPAVGISHNKVMIFDEESILTGSFNFSHAAEMKNAENLLFIRDPSLAHIYKKNWEERAKRARPLLSNR